MKKYAQANRRSRFTKSFCKSAITLIPHRIVQKENSCGKCWNKYYREFVERNKTRRVFSAHIHMDEATPHLHIDFVPYITESKRGLDTRVSLKQALGSLGFVGTEKQDTEWSQWIESEKKQLAVVMERYGIDRLDKSEHHEHLSVLNYKRDERAKEVAEHSEKIDELQKSKESLESELSELRGFILMKN